MVIVHPNFNQKVIACIKYLSEFSHVPGINNTVAFYSAFHKHILKDWKPLFLEIQNKEGSLIGLFPLMYRNELRKGIIPYRRLDFCLYKFGFCDIHAKPKEQEKLL